MHAPLGANTTLVCVLGNLAGGSLAHESLVVNVLRPLSADLALMLSLDSREESESLLLARQAKYIWRPATPAGHLTANRTRWSAIADALEPHWATALNASLNASGVGRPRPNIWGGVDWPPGGMTAAQPRTTLAGSGGVLMILRLLLLRNLDALARVGGMSYHHVIVTRADHYFACAHPPVTAVRPGEYVIPEGEDYGGITDRHGVFHFDDRVRVLMMLPWMAAHDDPRKIYSIEGAMRAFLLAQRIRVRRIARVMALLVVHLPGMVHHWRGHGPVPPEPLPGHCSSSSPWLKYPFEYVAMAGTCNLTLSPCSSGQSRGLAGYMRFCEAAIRNHTAFGCGMAMARASMTARKEIQHTA